MQQCINNNSNNCAGHYEEEDDKPNFCNLSLVCSVRRYALMVAEGIHHLHSHGFVHRCITVRE